MMEYASFVVTLLEGITTFDALNVMLRQGWRVERWDMLAHEGRATYAFLLKRVSDAEPATPADPEPDKADLEPQVEQTEAAEVSAERPLQLQLAEAVAGMSEDEAWQAAQRAVEDMPLEGELLERFKRAIRLDPNRGSERARLLDERTLSAPVNTLWQDEARARQLVCFLTSRQGWHAAVLLGDEHEAGFEALRIRRWLGENVDDEYDALLLEFTNNPAFVARKREERERTRKYLEHAHAAARFTRETGMHREAAEEVVWVTPS